MPLALGAGWLEALQGAAVFLGGERVGLGAAVAEERHGDRGQEVSCKERSKVPG